LHDIGVIKRVTETYRYYLIGMGRDATAALCRVTESIIIPVLASWDFSAESVKSQVVRE
jgi:hypothetical protein